MGYAVYEDYPARDYGVERWAGYGVPAICDFASCDRAIDRGMGYRCEKVYVEDPETEEEHADDGCNLHFCGEHESHNKHKGSSPKPDTAEWVAWMLTDGSWQQWRDENPEAVAKLTIEYRTLAGHGTPETTPPEGDYCNIGPCSAEGGHAGTCAEASGWDDDFADTPEPTATKEGTAWRCPRCGSARWVGWASSPGGPRKAQCVPCGAVSALPIEKV